MADVYIKLGELETVMTQLGEIVTEFEDATSNSEDLEADIANPFGQSALRDKAREFEERWDNKRDELKESLSEVRKHVKGVIEGFEDWDSKTAIAMESEE